MGGEYFWCYDIGFYIIEIKFGRNYYINNIEI